MFVDHANRRGSIRVQAAGTFFRNAPHPFAMLPYGIVRYHGAPADLRDIPLGTVLHVRAFLPPDPKISAVPVLPVNNKEKIAGYSGTGVAPAENHVLLLEDEPSHCLREGKVWKLKEVDLKNNEGMIVASREPKAGGDGKASEEKLTFDAATRIWRGRECLGDRRLDRRGHLARRAGRNRSTARPSCSASPGSPRRMACSPASTSRTSGWMTPPRNAPRRFKPRRTRPSSAAAGCPPGSMPSSMASSAAPP